MIFAASWTLLVRTPPHNQPPSRVVNPLLRVRLCRVVRWHSRFPRDRWAHHKGTDGQDGSSSRVKVRGPSNFQLMWNSKGGFNESGPSIVHMRCLCCVLFWRLFQSLLFTCFFVPVLSPWSFIHVS